MTRDGWRGFEKVGGLIQMDEGERIDVCENVVDNDEQSGGTGEGGRGGMVGRTRGRRCGRYR